VSDAAFAPLLLRPLLFDLVTEMELPLLPLFSFPVPDFVPERPEAPLGDLLLLLEGRLLELFLLVAMLYFLLYKVLLDLEATLILDPLYLLPTLPLVSVLRTPALPFGASYAIPP
jgi:hypothetical protein